MKIEKREIRIGDIVEGYIDNEERGCWGYRGLLNIRPAYQREFVYGQKDREAVIDSIKNNMPLNTFYWVRNEDGTYEVLDGQQRTLSFCQFVDGLYSIDYRYFKHQWSKEEQEQLLNYTIDVYICEGPENEKLTWFQRINKVGVELTEQELRNAVYHGAWLNNAKTYFSKTGCQAYNIAKQYMKGTPIRQDYLEEVLDWISNGNIEQYMADHCKRANAEELWQYFMEVIGWVESIFPVYYKEMKGLPWGKYFNIYRKNNYNPDFLVQDLKQLMADDDVTKKSGIFEYLLSGKDPSKEKLLSIRTFLPGDKRTVYEQQGGICPKCGKHFEIEEMEADHIVPWVKGGKTTIDNCQLLCKHCNKQLSDNG